MKKVVNVNGEREEEAELVRGREGETLASGKAPVGPDVGLRESGREVAPREAPTWWEVEAAKFALRLRGEIEKSVEKRLERFARELVRGAV